MENGPFIIQFHANNNKINHLVSDPHGVPRAVLIRPEAVLIRPEAVLIRPEAVAMGSVTQKVDALYRSCFIHQQAVFDWSVLILFRLPTFCNSSSC